MEDEPAPAQVRRVLGRPLGLGSPRPLIRLSPRLFSICLAAGLLVRLLTLPLAGTGDVDVWKIWSYGASTSLTAMYGVGGSPPERGLVRWGEQATTVDYPPGTLYGLAIVGHVFQRIDPGYRDGPWLTATIKASILLFDVLLTFAVFRLTARLADEGAARAAAVAYWLNPAALLDGAVLGYLDPWMAAPALFAFAAAAAGQATMAGVCLGLAVLVKAQAAFVVPPVALLVWHAAPRHRPRAAISAAAGFAATLAAGVLPFALRGALPNLAQALASLFRHDMLSGTAANAWWIVTWFLRGRDELDALGPIAAWAITVKILPISSFVALGFPNPRPIGTALVLLTAGWALWRAHAGLAAGAARTLAVAAAAFIIHAYFVLGAQVHENHLYLAVPLLAVTAAAWPRYRGVFAAVSAIFALNLFLFYGVGRGFPLPPRGVTGIDATVLLSAANVAALAWHARVFGTAARPT